MLSRILFEELVLIRANVAMYWNPSAVLHRVHSSCLCLRCWFVDCFSLITVMTSCIRDFICLVWTYSDKSKSYFSIWPAFWINCTFTFSLSAVHVFVCPLTDVLVALQCTVALFLLMCLVCPCDAAVWLIYTVARGHSVSEVSGHKCLVTFASEWSMN